VVRAVLDPNVIISALLSPKGAPARVLRAWIEGAFEFIVSPLLLAELERALAYPKLRRHIEPEEARRVVQWLRRSAKLTEDPDDPPSVRSPDPGDDYLIALAESQQAVLVSGDEHLVGLSEELPIYRPARFLHLLEVKRGGR
jgi:putative PIN family toxin of toxin-antitoxin system